jgi:integrase
VRAGSPRYHILPRFGATTIGEIKPDGHQGVGENTAPHTGRTDSGRRGHDAVHGAGRRRRGRPDRRQPLPQLRTNVTSNPERPHAQPRQVLRIAQRCRPTDTLLILTAAYTDIRWGERAGLQWSNLHLRRAELLIHPEEGALHEVSGQLTLGPPKTAANARTVHLPPFLVGLLTEHHHEHDHQFVFTGADDGPLRRSNFRNRVWLPAVEGHTRRGWTPLFPGLHFHDLCHTHKTWLIEVAVPQVAQFKRLGHRLAGVRGIYSHVSQPMIDHLLGAALQRRWEQTRSTHPVTTTVPEVRARPFAPNLLPTHQNGRPTKIVNRPSDQHIQLVGDTGIEPVTPTVSN